jgi:hypothetical protein
MGAVVRYALGWLLATGAVVAAITAVLLVARGDGEEQLVAAAQRAGCQLREDSGEAERARLGDMMPPTFGPSRRAAAPGRYGRPPRLSELVGALREGRIVVQYRPSLPRREIDRLDAVRRSDPRDVILTPDQTRMPYEVAATAWQRLLGCPVSASSQERAIRAFIRYFRDTAPTAPR